MMRIVIIDEISWWDYISHLDRRSTYVKCSTLPYRPKQNVAPNSLLILLRAALAACRSESGSVDHWLEGDASSHIIWK